MENHFDVLVIGKGIAAMTAALQLASSGVRVALISKGDGSNTNSSLAQGGIVYKAIDDKEEYLVQDVLEAGKNIGDLSAIQFLAKRGPELIESFLIDKVKVPFDRTADGLLSITQEGAHSKKRIIHFKDHTGKAIIDALEVKVDQHPNIKVYANVKATRLLHDEERGCYGAICYDLKNDCLFPLLASFVVLAAGGVGNLYLSSTNHNGIYGEGLALAKSIGAETKNLEYLQFHPTCFYGENVRFLLSEAMRGEGAILLDADLKPFMHLYDEKKDLAPRDVVSKSMYIEMQKSDVSHLYLDISHKESSWIKNRFPMLYEKCLEQDIDMTKNPIPVAPAAHYHCGGVVVDLKGRTSIPNLYAVGEVSCTGIHGANRLASTSLLEGLVWGDACSTDIMQNFRKASFPDCIGIPSIQHAKSDEEKDLFLINLQTIMWEHVGIMRTSKGLETAISKLKKMQNQVIENNFFDPHQNLMKNALVASLAIAESALLNKNSLGCHIRLDD